MTSQPDAIHALSFKQGDPLIASLTYSAARPTISPMATLHPVIHDNTNDPELISLSLVIVIDHADIADDLEAYREETDLHAISYLRREARDFRAAAEDYLHAIAQFEKNRKLTTLDAAHLTTLRKLTKEIIEAANEILTTRRPQPH
ncbi:hypothetical protein [Hyphomicrobium sp. CS1BSMeth3]|uniref:hypothetical protein n=1 Tax=Hyphomicrobium sp. CS1BSMeth3 TaxID=1892844 RepID=UPI001160AF11|nr:hypothetical protein [Hyphomicrobium sp. CS1BSMeth3]